MRTRYCYLLPAVLLSLLVPVVLGEKSPDAKDGTQATKQAPAAAPLPDLPGLTTPDRTPHACVDCHVRIPDQNKDYRLTTVLAGWKDKGEPEIVAKAKAAAPQPERITGKHPDIKGLVKVLPTDCLMCHNSAATVAPPFKQLLHLIHVAGGKESHFFTHANGNCTSCHKLDTKTGAWKLGSGEEK